MILQMGLNTIALNQTAIGSKKFKQYIKCDIWTYIFMMSNYFRGHILKLL